MAVVALTGESAEVVAYALYQALITAADGGGDKEQRHLDLYARCLEATKGSRKLVSAVPSVTDKLVAEGKIKAL